MTTDLAGSASGAGVEGQAGIGEAAVDASRAAGGSHGAARKSRKARTLSGCEPCAMVRLSDPGQQGRSDHTGPQSAVPELYAVEVHSWLPLCP